jgi:hypothetical protein
MSDNEGHVTWDGHRTWYRRRQSPCRAGFGACRAAARGGPGGTHDYLEPLLALADGGRPVVLYDQPAASAATCATRRRRSGRSTCSSAS